MKILSWLLASLVLVGCTGTHRQGTSQYDGYDSVKVDQMVGNNVSGKLLQKTIVCLNGRRESRQVTSITNVQTLAITNQAVVAATNQTISFSTNFLFTTMTNLAPPQLVLAAPGAAEGETVAGKETNALVVLTNPPAAITTNISISLASNQSGTASPNQAAANVQQIRTVNNQLTITSNSLTISLMTNLVVTGETNQVVTYSTNITVTALTNITITPTNLTVRDYYLYTELTPPPDFTAATGDNLILLVDGTRYAFAPTPPTAAFTTRKGYTDSLYRVPPEVLVAIANAREVKMRLRGTTTAIDRTLSNSSRQNFKKFMLKYFAPDPTAVTPARKLAAKSDVETLVP